MRLIRWTRRYAAYLRGRDDGQSMAEYALVAGGVVIALIASLYGLQIIVPQVLGLVCPSIDTAAGVGATAGSCVTFG